MLFLITNSPVLFDDPTPLQTIITAAGTVLSSLTTWATSITT